MKDSIFVRSERMIVPVPHHILDDTEETVQGKSHTVRELYHDFVLGRLDQSQIGGSPVYDPEGSEEVDDFNHFGVTLEEATLITDKGRAAADEIRRQRSKQQQTKSSAADDPPASKEPSKVNDEAE